MATHPDYYSILGVKKAAAPEEIRKAYKKLARKFHPDANPDDATTLEKFKQIQAAWAVLGDEKKRSNFDKYGTPDEPRSYDDRSQAGEGPRSWSAESGEVPFDIEELFGSFGGGRPGGSHRTHRGDWAVRGHDIRTQIQVPFQMAAEGGTYELRLQRDDGSPPETLAIAIPAGIDTGSVVRLAGQGAPGSSGGTAGDLLVSLNIAPHPWFRREGANVLLEIPISVSESGLGTKVDIPTVLDGVITLTIPPGTSSGSKLRLRGKGIRDRRTGK
ncbi:MAG: DnaJ C-terminal domain-containing protein, partial [Planctomycetaceae bacterium]